MTLAGMYLFVLFIYTRSLFNKATHIQMAFAGCTSINQITRDYVAPRIPLSVRLLAGKL